MAVALIDCWSQSSTVVSPCFTDLRGLAYRAILAGNCGQCGVGPAADRRSLHTSNSRSPFASTRICKSSNSVIEIVTRCLLLVETVAGLLMGTLLFGIGIGDRHSIAATIGHYLQLQ